MNIAICERLDPAEVPPFTELQREHRVRFFEDALTAANAQQIADADVVSLGLVSVATPEVLQKLEHVRLIAVRGTGVDAVDLGYCKDHGIAVANVPAYGVQSVAEHAFALLLAISHSVTDAVEHTRRGTFSRVGLRGFELAGKTIGVIGAGQIGSAVIRMANGFGMTALAYGQHPDPDRARALGFTFVSLDELLQRSDVVTLHVPLDEHTRHMIGRQQLAIMKPGAVLINTARGGLVDAPALAEALREGRLRAAGLDVLAEEPAFRDTSVLFHEAFEEKRELETLLANEVLLELPNAIVTPHIAAYTEEAVARIAATTVSNILAFARGQPEDLVT